MGEFDWVEGAWVLGYHVGLADPAVGKGGETAAGGRAGDVCCAHGVNARDMQELRQAGELRHCRVEVEWALEVESIANVHEKNALPQECLSVFLNQQSQHLELHMGHLIVGVRIPRILRGQLLHS